MTGPPSFSWGRVLTSWELDPVLTVLTVWVAGAYLSVVWLLRPAVTRPAGSLRRTLPGERPGRASSARPVEFPA